MEGQTVTQPQSNSTTSTTQPMEVEDRVEPTNNEHVDVKSTESTESTEPVEAEFSPPGDKEIPVPIPENSKVKGVLESLMKMSEAQRNQFLANIAKANKINAQNLSFSSMSEKAYDKYKRKMMEQKNRRTSQSALKYQQKKQLQKQQELLKKQEAGDPQTEGSMEDTKSNKSVDSKK